MFKEKISRNRLKWTVLIVDDDPDLGKLLIQYLTHIGIDTRLEKDGFDALEHFSPGKTPPDLVLTDIALPGMDGYELLEAIKRHHPTTPVVFLTGSDETNARQDGEYSPDVFLKKPVRLADLEKVVLGILNRMNNDRQTNNQSN